MVAIRFAACIFAGAKLRHDDHSVCLCVTLAIQYISGHHVFREHLSGKEAVINDFIISDWLDGVVVYAVDVRPRVLKSFQTSYRQYVLQGVDEPKS